MATNKHRGDNPVVPTASANMLLTIIADRFHIRKKAIWPDHEWSELGLSPADKEAVLDEIQAKFYVCIPADARDGIRTVWDALKWVEGHAPWYRGGARPTA